MISKIVSLGLLMFTPFSIAAIDGRLGSSSEAEIQISLTISSSFQINTDSAGPLDVFERVIDDSSVDSIFTRPFCVVGNGSAKYTLIVSGSYLGGELLLENVDGGTLAYSVLYQKSALDTAPDVLTPGTPSRVYNTLPNSAACIDGPEIYVVFGAEELQAAIPALYRGAVTLLVSPV